MPALMELPGPRSSSQSTSQMLPVLRASFMQEWFCQTRDVSGRRKEERRGVERGGGHTRALIFMFTSSNINLLGSFTVISMNALKIPLLEFPSWHRG